MRVRFLTLLLGLLAWAGPAGATPPCEVTLSFVAFGRVDARDDEAVSGEVMVACDEPTSFALALSEGRGSFAQRRMAGPGGAELVYNVYLDPGHRRVWGDGNTAGTGLLSGRSDGRRQTVLPVYALVPRGQARPAGSYHDTLMVTLQP